jgi:hypothetical protein
MWREWMNMVGKSMNVLEWVKWRGLSGLQNHRPLYQRGLRGLWNYERP